MTTIGTGQATAVTVVVIVDPSLQDVGQDSQQGGGITAVVWMPVWGVALGRVDSSSLFLPSWPLPLWLVWYHANQLQCLACLYLQLLEGSHRGCLRQILTIP